MKSLSQNILASPRRRRGLSTRGQALVEYSLISFLLLLGGSAVLLVVIDQLFDGLNEFLNSIYTVIQTAAL